MTLKGNITINKVGVWPKMSAMRQKWMLLKTETHGLSNEVEIKADAFTKNRKWRFSAALFDSVLNMYILRSFTVQQKA